MALDFSFSPSEITVNNLRKLSRKQSLTEEQRFCELSELADSACDAARELYLAGMTPSEITSCLGEGLSFNVTEIHTEGLPENKESLMLFEDFSSAYDKAVFSQLLVNKLKGADVSFREDDFLQQGEEGSVFSYVKNQYSDEAFDVFSENVNDPRVSYSSSFTEAVKKLNAGIADFCLLPLEERGGVRLPTVSELIYANDLKINAVTPVFGYTGNGEIKYATVSKCFIIEEYSMEDDRYFEIRLETDSGIAVTELGLAAAVFGMEVYRINTFTSVADSGAVCNYSAVIRKTGGDFLPLLVYLALFFPSYTPVGLYKNLE